MRAEEDLANVGVPPQGNQLPLQDQAPVILPPMQDGEIRSTFVTFRQAMSTQDQVVATQYQAMKDLENWKVGPRVQQQTNTMASHLRDFKKMNPPMFVGSKVNE